MSEEGSTSKKSSTHVDDDTMTQILARLPLRSLPRLTYGLRREHLLKDPWFGWKFLDLHAKESHKVLVTFRLQLARLAFFSLDLESGISTPIRPLHQPPYSGRVSIVRDSLDGLIGFEHDDRTYLMNLTTEEILQLPETVPPRCALSTCVSGPFSTLGSDGQRKYKILHSWAPSMGDPDPDIRSTHKILELGNPVWREIGTGPLKLHPLGSVFLDGALHFLTPISYERNSIVAFDVSAETFNSIALPEDAASYGNRSKLVLFNGHLALLAWGRVERKQTILIYEMTNNNDRTWEVHKVVMPLKEGEQLRMFHLTLISSGEIMLTPKNMTGAPYFLLYDMETKSLREVEIQGLPKEVPSPIRAAAAPTEWVHNILKFNQMF